MLMGPQVSRSKPGVTRLEIARNIPSVPRFLSPGFLDFASVPRFRMLLRHLQGVDGAIRVTMPAVPEPELWRSYCA